MRYNEHEGSKDVMMMRPLENLMCKTWFPPAVLLVAVFLVYAACFTHEFIPMWDDSLYILNNEDIKGVSLHNLKSAFTTSYGGNYAPLHIISYMFDYSLWGLSPAGFIATNVVLHALNGYLLYLLLSSSTGTSTASLLAAMFFCVHPVQVESVAWISERKNMLSLFFMLLAMICYAKYTCPSRNGKKKLSVYGAALFFFVLALLTKSVVVVLPTLLFGWDYFVLGKRGWKSLLQDNAPFLLLGIAFAVFTVFSQDQEMGGGRLSFQARPLGMTILTMLPVFWSYLKMVVLPFSLSPWYEPVIRTRLDWKVLVSLLLLAVLFIAARVLAKRGMLKEVYWGAVFFVGLLPVSNIIPIVTMMNDRYLYLPMLGASGLICAIGSKYFEKRAVVVPFIALLLFFSLLSFRQTSIWKNNLTLWNAAFQKNPGSAYVTVRLARSYASAGMKDKAVDLLNQILQNDPENVEALFRLGELTLESGELFQAKRYLDRMYRLSPRYVDGLLALGREAFFRKSLREAERYFEELLVIKPQHVQARIWLSNVYQETGRMAEARTLLSMALVKAGQTDRAGIYYNLACLENIEGSIDKALEMLEKAMLHGFSDLETLRTNRGFDLLRDHSRYRAIEASMGKATEK